MNKPVVSIIIITRNRPFLLGHCLERVWSQSSIGTSHDQSGSYRSSHERLWSQSSVGTSHDQSGSYRSSHERLWSQPSVGTSHDQSGSHRSSPERLWSQPSVGTSHDQSGSYRSSDGNLVLRNFEVIVVDSSTNDESERVIARYPATKHIRVRGARNNMPQARNTGIACSTGEIIAFIDDDSMVQPSWLEALLDVYRDKTIGAAGGRVITMPEPYCDEIKGPPRLHVTRLGGVIAKDAGLVSEERTEVDHLIGCNMSFRRTVLEEVGGFDSNFTLTNLREETYLCLRVKRAGWRIVFEPGIAVVHFSARSLQPYFLERPTIQFSNGRNGSYFAIKHFGLTPRSIGGQLIDAGRSCGRAVYFIGLFSAGTVAQLAGRVAGVAAGIRWLKNHNAHDVSGSYSASSHDQAGSYRAFSEDVSPTPPVPERELTPALAAYERELSPIPSVPEAQPQGIARRTAINRRRTR